MDDDNEDDGIPESTIVVQEVDLNARTAAAREMSTKKNSGRNGNRHTNGTNHGSTSALQRPKVKPKSIEKPPPIDEEEEEESNTPLTSLQGMNNIFRVSYSLKLKTEL